MKIAVLYKNKLIKANKMKDFDTQFSKKVMKISKNIGNENSFT